MNIPKLVSLASGDGKLWVAGYSDFYACTWQCSHVRLCRVDADAPDYSREEALAWILRRNDADYLPDWKACLTKIDITSDTLENLRSTIRACTNDVADSENIDSPTPFPIRESDIPTDIAVFRLEGLQLYQFGPTQVFCWETGSSFFYLETHYES